ncbi:MAG: DUF4190 domain-containing protein [Clostridiales bacterium]|nr:DUF4190 domain-containing protein [Clostridiales bacterium]
MDQNDYGSGSENQDYAGWQNSDRQGYTDYERNGSGQNYTGYQGDSGANYQNSYNGYTDHDRQNRWNGYEGYGGYSNGENRGRRPGRGLAVAAVVLGILSLLTSVTVAGGILLGVIGIVLAILSRKQRPMRTSAKVGMGFSIAGIVLSVVILAGTILWSVSFINEYLQDPYGIYDYFYEYGDEYGDEYDFGNEYEFENPGGGFSQSGDLPGNSGDSSGTYSL